VLHNEFVYAPFSFFRRFLPRSRERRRDQANVIVYRERKEICYSEAGTLSVLRTRILDRITDHPLFVRVASTGTVLCIERFEEILTIKRRRHTKNSFMIPSYVQVVFLCTVAGEGTAPRKRMRERERECIRGWGGKGLNKRKGRAASFIDPSFIDVV